MKLWKKLALLLAAPLLLGWLGLLWFNHRAKAAWEDYRAEQEALGISFDWEDTIPDRVPDDENFALAPVLEDERTIRALNPFNAYSDWKQPRGYRGWQASQLFPFEESYLIEDGDAIAALKAHYQQHEATFRSLIEASKLPYCREPIDYQDIYRVYGRLPSKLRHVAKALTVAAAFRLAQDEADTAHELILAHTRIVDHSHPREIAGFLMKAGLVSYTVPPIWEGLAIRAWNDAQLADFEDYLRSIDLMKDLVHCLEQEPIIAAKIYPDLLINAKRRAIVFDLDQPLVTLLVHLAPEAIIYRNLLVEMKLNAQWIEIAKSSQLRPKVEDLSQEIEARQSAFFGNPHPFEVLAIDNLRAFVGVFSSLTSAQIANDLARVGVALERHRLAEGHYPESLDGLTPKWLATVPLDRITQEPLHYQIKEDGTIQVYSIGWNNQDDGGIFEKGLRSGDEVWQYTNP